MGRTTLLLMVGLMLGGCGKSQTGGATAARPEPDANYISFGQIFSEYENAAEGDAKYKDKWVTFSALVKAVRNSPDGGYIVEIYVRSDSTNHGGEIAFSKDQAAEVATLKAYGPGVPSYKFQAFCTGKKYAYVSKNGRASGAYMINFLEGKSFGPTEQIKPPVWPPP